MTNKQNTAIEFLRGVDTTLNGNYFKRVFRSHFTDTAEFYKLSQEDQRIVSAVLTQLANELANLTDTIFPELAGLVKGE